MARKQRFREEEEAAVDMTPMLDIVFIMLIFFIVTTSFVKEAGIEVNKPKAAQATKQKNANIFNFWLFWTICTYLKFFQYFCLKSIYFFKDFGTNILKIGHKFSS